MKTLMIGDGMDKPVELTSATLKAVGEKKKDTSIGEFMGQLILASRKDRALKNFLDHHHISRVLKNGVPVWRQHPSWHGRGKNVFMIQRRASVPGGLRRRQANV